MQFQHTDEKVEQDDTDDETETTDEEFELPVEIEEVKVEPVLDNIQFTARIARVAKQAEFVHNEQGNRRETLFYKIVLAGNVRVTSHVLDLLEAKEKTDVINWLLMKGKRHRLLEIPIKNKIVLKTMQVVWFLLLAFISFICSPIFYMIHSFTTGIFSQQKHRLAANIQLPLAFAAFSKDEDMMKYFLSKGVNIKTSDREGNTVFHYIADLSSESTNRAMEIFTRLSSLSMIRILSNS